MNNKIKNVFAKKLWDKTRVAETGCWLWEGSRRVQGYGVLSFGREKKRSYIYAHRFSWELNKGPIPNGMLVLHTCDIRNCVNPNHLFLGTHQDNSTDMVNKGRSLTGEKQPNSKLTKEQVLEIKHSKESSAVLAERFGVHFGYINSLKRGERWKKELAIIKSLTGDEVFTTGEFANENDISRGAALEKLKKLEKIGKIERCLVVQNQGGVVRKNVVGWRFVQTGNSLIGTNLSDKSGRSGVDTEEDSTVAQSITASSGRGGRGAVVRSGRGGSGRVKVSGEEVDQYV